MSYTWYISQGLWSDAESMQWAMTRCWLAVDVMWHLLSASKTWRLRWFIWVFPKIGVPQNGWFIMETLLQWMIWGYHYFWKHPYNVGLTKKVKIDCTWSKQGQNHWCRAHISRELCMIWAHTFYIQTPERVPGWAVLWCATDTYDKRFGAVNLWPCNWHVLNELPKVSAARFTSQIDIDHAHMARFSMPMPWSFLLRILCQYGKDP